MHKILFYNKFVSCLYMFRAHVLETCRGMKQTYCKTKFRTSSWLITKINILRCTVSKTSKFIISLLGICTPKKLIQLSVTKIGLNFHDK